ncbi:hypothetical protein [Cryobacterium sp. TMT2-42-4]|uniref:hypothetical protein n=1 Tax=Cryobacterium sp. TMT2-42-4 TaxID=1259255 RepID=UPI00106C1359|nr:hypothetical protein [Cryobacterium sp. TMT2-42-4]TFC35454.1 hypothetical protein E3O18_10060 [Cryobacterium sp. TMT2-42-4]
MSPENAAENENATGPEPPTSGRPPAGRRAWIGLVVLGAALLVILVVAVVWRDGEGFPGAGETTGTGTVTPAPTNAPTATGSPTTTTTPPATLKPTQSEPGQTAAPGVPRSTACTQLYSPAMVEALGDLTLYPFWNQDPDAGVSHGTDDAELRVQIDALDHLTCVWASPYGGSDTGIITTVVWVIREESAAVEARLVANGLECFT